jgi:ATP-dependent exoDNAse (exonuclease V) alpha subunit
VAIFRLQIKTIGRNEGRRATSAAAYRAGERIRDEQSGDLHNYSRRKDVTHKEIMLPSHLAGAGVEWARDRSSLWNTVERAETRRNARVAREYQVTLPAELSAEQRRNLARTFSQEVADRYQVAVDLAIHDPRPDGDPRNFHAHLLATTREVTETGLGAKTSLDLRFGERERLGMSSSSQEYTAIRERWATLTNEAFRDAHIDARIDHRSLEAQGIDREPRPSIPFAAFNMERNGKRSEVAERLRAEYSARVQARLDRAAERSNAARTNANQQSKGIRRDAAQAGAAEVGKSADPAAESVKAWLQFRAAQGPEPADPAAESVKAWARYRDAQGREPAEAGPRTELEEEQRTDRSRDNDYSL